MDHKSIPLLKTKLYIPPQRPNLVPRPRLIAQMDEALHWQHRLTLVSARAGAGKTTLVRQWLHQQERPAAWISLDEDDNDPQRFFGYLAAALQGLNRTTSLHRLDELEVQERPPVETLIVTLINEIAASSIPLILVLDDYHILQNDTIHKAIGFLVEHQPPEMHLVLTTRVDPPLPLAQLRARGQLTEIRDRDLLFTAGESVQFFHDVMGLNLPPVMVATIEQRTEGWIAGLQMAAISARGHQQEGDLGAFIEAFGGTNRFILDYLTEEVLHQQRQAVQDFLIETSILNRMCGGLCDAVRCGRAPDSQSILEELERTNLFVTALDDERHWYRYHRLFADLLQSILRQRRSTDQIRELHRRAGRWYLGEGLPGEAMPHILAARDFELAASVIDENIARLIHMFSRGRDPQILSWIEELPEEIKRSRPWIDVYRANMLALNLQLDEVDPILDDVETRVEPGSPRSAEILGHTAAVRAYTANLRGDAARAIAMASLAKAYLPGEDYLVAQTMVAYTLADTYFAMDDMERAGRSLLDMLRFGEKAGQLLIIVPALCQLAAIKQVQGQLYQAEECYASAYQWLVERNSLNSRLRCSYEFGLAGLLLERNQLDQAREHAMTGIEVRKRLGGYRVLGDLAWMRVLQAQGDAEGAMKALRSAEQAVQSHPFQLALMIEFKTARVIQWLAVGNVEMASRWARECSGGSEQEQIVLARLSLAQGRASDAQGILDRQRMLAEAGGRTGRLIEILCLQAVALEVQGLPGEAENALSQAFSLARPEGYVRVFLDLGQQLGVLLERLAERDAGGDARAILDAFQQEKGRHPEAAPQSTPLTQAMLDPLSEREYEVFRLLAEGLSNKEIAGRLFVAPGTIKQHLKNIFRKLDVHSRVQAVRRGRALKLL